MILVSHDRYFVSKTANKIWEIVDHEIKEFKGGYEEWVAWKERMAKQSAVGGRKSEVGGQKSEVGGQKSEVGSKKSDVGGRKSDVGGRKSDVGSQKSAGNKPAHNHVSSPINKDEKKELQKLQKQFQQIEESIARLNEQKKELELLLTSPGTYSDKNKFLQTETDYKKISEELSRQNTQYEQVFEKIVKLEKN